MEDSIIPTISIPAYLHTSPACNYDCVSVQNIGPLPPHTLDSRSYGLLRHNSPHQGNGTPEAHPQGESSPGRGHSLLVKAYQASR